MFSLNPANVIVNLPRLEINYISKTMFDPTSQSNSCFVRMPFFKMANLAYEAWSAGCCAGPRGVEAARLRLAPLERAEVGLRGHTYTYTYTYTYTHTHTHTRT